MIDDFILEFKKGNYNHFSTFYEATYRNVFFSAYTILKDKVKAEDIMQDTYTIFLNSIYNFKIGNNVNAYLAKISRNLSINYYNHEKRIVYNNELNDFRSTENHDSTNDINEILKLLDSDTERSIVIYHVICDYKFKEIAKIIDKPLGTVLWIYNKAINKLKERIGDIYEK